MSKIEVESINRSGNQAETVIRGANAGEHLDALLLDPNCIFDVGASNIETFFDAMRERGAYEDVERKPALHGICPRPLT